jgi:hypothetical protein
MVFVGQLQHPSDKCAAAAPERAMGGMKWFFTLVSTHRPSRFDSKYPDNAEPPRQNAMGAAKLPQAASLPT